MYVWGGRGRGRCPHTRWSRSSAGFPRSSCWAPAAARRWGGRRRSGRQTGGKLGSREWSSRWRGRSHGWHVDDHEWSADKARVWANVSAMKCARNKTMRAHDTRSQWMYLWVCSMCSATQAVKCVVASSSPSSLASVSLSFRFHSYNFTFPHCVLIVLVVILYPFSTCFHRILTAA